MTDHTNLLEQSFELNLNNYGPEDVERLNDWAINAYRVLEALQAEVKHLNLHLKATQNGRDAALARLAITEEANSMLLARNKWLEHTLEVAGASPVEPSQALSLDLLERLSKTLTRLGYATPEGGMEHFNAGLANQLYNLCRAVDSLFDREQPPAPGEAAREYMTGYSDCREWAQPSQAVEISDEEQVALLRFNETCEDGQGYDVKTSMMMSRLAEIGVVYRKFGSIYLVTEYGQRVIAAINAKEQPNG